MKALFRVVAVVMAMFATAGFAAEGDWVGKTIVIKTSKEGNQGICIKGNALELGPVNKDPAASHFKVLAGGAPGNVIFESVGQPSTYLHHYGGNFVLLPQKGPDAQWRIVPPLQGKQGVSIQHGLITNRYLTESPKGGWHIGEKIERKRDAIFHLEEVK